MYVSSKPRVPYRTISSLAVVAFCPQAVVTALVLAGRAIAPIPIPTHTAR